jgi:cysteine desulfurase
MDAVVESVTMTVARLREMSPLWDMHRNGVDFRTVQWAAH